MHYIFSTPEQSSGSVKMLLKTDGLRLVANQKAVRLEVTSFHHPSAITKSQRTASICVHKEQILHSTTAYEKKMFVHTI